MTGPIRLGGSLTPRRVDVERSDLQLPSTVLTGGDPNEETGVSPNAALGQIVGFGDRYELEGVIGRGGMGEVHACRDRVVGRQIAMKRMRVGTGSGPSVRRATRFVREARVQGQLEHPAILPVYDLGVAPDGDPYFTMKRVHGQSLAEVLRASRDTEGGPPVSVRRLLTVFSQVCLAVDFIHSRGVVHRDLKPSNVMLGTYGEVYLVDWGLATLLDPDASSTESRPPGAEVLGTPGYMAPEQAGGAPVDPRADVYSLGAILFELLAGETLHSGAVNEILVSTLGSDGARPSTRGANVSPELDDLCAHALKLDPSERLSSAKAMSEAIESFLDGVRDLERRNARAGEHAARAREALDASETSDREADDRARAMREVTQALAFDPSNADAIQILVTLYTRPPRQVPKEAEDAFAATHDRMMRVSMKSLIIAYLGYLVYVPFPFLLGVRSYTAFAVVACGTLSCLFVALWQVSRKHLLKDARLHLFVALVTACISTVIFGPLIMVPMLAMVCGLGYVALLPGRWIRGAVASSVAAMLPFVLHMTGVLPDTVQITGDAIVSGAWLMSFPKVPTALFLVFCHAAIISMACYYVARTQKENDAARRALHVQAWHLEQILPRQRE